MTARIGKIIGICAGIILITAFTAFAEDVWKEQDGQWYCYDQNGYQLSGVQRKYGIYYYYLDDQTGAMVTDRVVDVDGYKYYYGSDGARIADRWVKVNVDNDGDGYEYMYFKSNGKAATEGLSLKQEDGTTKRYRFNEEGYMLHGYLTEEYDQVSCPSLAMYYYGTKDQGWRYSGWVNITDGSDETYPEVSSLWFYFGPSGKKIENRKQYKVASGLKYTFEADTGKMVTGWVDASTSEAPVNTTSAVNCQYYGKSNDGILKKDEWIATQDFNEENDFQTYWYYVDKSGTVVSGTDKPGEKYEEYGNRSNIAKVQKKYYCFEDDGRRKTGFVFGMTDDPTDPTAFFIDKKLTEKATQSATEYNKQKASDHEGNRLYYIRYFSMEPDTEEEGVMQKGKVTVTLDGSEFEVYFDKNGIAYEGVVDKKIYNNGVLQTAGTRLTDLVTCNSPATVGAVHYPPQKTFLVDKNGKILFNSKTRDSDGIYWVTTNNTYSPIDEYIIYKLADQEYASIVATEIKNTKEAEWDTYLGSQWVLRKTLTLGGRKYNVYAKMPLGAQYREVRWTEVTD